jgi:hypothetical protein
VFFSYARMGGQAWLFNARSKYMDNSKVFFVHCGYSTNGAFGQQREKNTSTKQRAPRQINEPLFGNVMLESSCAHTYVLAATAIIARAASEDRAKRRKEVSECGSSLSLSLVMRTPHPRTQAGRVARKGTLKGLPFIFLPRHACCTCLCQLRPVYEGSNAVSHNLPRCH